MTKRTNNRSWLFRLSKLSKHGIAIPLVLTFIVVISLFAFTIIRMRTESKFTNLVTFHYLKAHLMAQSGIQHAMMKIRLFPDEAFEAAARQYGICPMNDGASLSGGGGNPDLMNHFISDMVCTSLGVPGTDGWGYQVKKIETKTAFRKDNKLITVVEIFSEGFAIEGKGGLNKRTELVRKTVSIVKN